MSGVSTMFSKPLGTEVTNIGTVSNAENSSGETTADSTWTTIETLSLPAGTYVVVGDLTFNASSNGIRILILDVTESTVNLYNNSVLASGRADLSKTRIITLNSTTTIYLRSYQSSGSSLNVRGQIRAIRIK